MNFNRLNELRKKIADPKFRTDSKEAEIIIKEMIEIIKPGIRKRNNK